MSQFLHLVFAGLPPTSNHIFVKGHILTREARDYAEQFSKEMVRYQHLIHQMNESADVVYGVHLRFYMNLVNESWNNPSVAPSKRAKSRYKKIDLDNRVKLITDCVRDAIAVDDSHIFAASQEKHHVLPGPQEHVEIMVHEVDPRLFGL